MPRLTYEYVKEYIQESGDQLVSDEYTHSKTVLDIKCSYCDVIFKCSYMRYQQGLRHGNCKNVHLRSEKYKEMRNPRSTFVRKATQEVECKYCSKIF